MAIIETGIFLELVVLIIYLKINLIYRRVSVLKSEGNK